MKKISVIVPIYNCEEYIERCLQSIINQTYKNLEIILINDGSTDGSIKICEKYKQSDYRIKLINQKNSGVSVARNNGIEISTGEYITFVDSDDYIDSKMYEELINNIENCDIAVCKYVSIKNEIMISQHCNYNKKIINKKDIIPLFLQGDVLTAHLWNKLYKRDLFDGIKFNNYNMLEDLDVMYRILDKCQNIAYIEKEYYYYVYNTSSLTKKYGIPMLNDYCSCINNMHKYFENNKQYKPYLIYNKVITYCTLFELVAKSNLTKKEKMNFKEYYCEFKMNFKKLDKELYVQFSKKQKCKLLLLNFNKSIFMFAIKCMKGIKNK